MSWERDSWIDRQIINNSQVRVGPNSGSTFSFNLGDWAYSRGPFIAALMMCSLVGSPFSFNLGDWAYSRGPFIAALMMCSLVGSPFSFNLGDWACSRGPFIAALMMCSLVGSTFSFNLGDWACSRGPFIAALMMCSLVGSPLLMPHLETEVDPFIIASRFVPSSGPKAAEKSPKSELL